MHIITRKRIQEFAAAHPDSASALATWYRIVSNAEYGSIVDLRAHFQSVDFVAGYYVFNIGGNKVRLIAAIHFDRRKLYIRHILTHQEYDRGAWKRG